MGASKVILFAALLIGLASARHTLVSDHGHHDRGHLTDPPATVGCPSRNAKLAGWIKDKLNSGAKVIPQSTTFDAFVLEIKAALEANHLPLRAIEYIFHEAAPFNPTCSGNWMEFGVFRGDTINHAAQFRTQHCGEKCPPVTGFDTFTGLPEKWEIDHESKFNANEFTLDGKYPKVEKNVELVKGLFSESLPKFLKEQAHFTGANQTLSYLHVDCDLYAGAKDALTIMSPAIKPGTIILFDELVNYARFREHEILAFWEYLRDSGTKVLPIGMAGPLPGKTYAVNLDIKTGEEAWFHQSAAFVVVSQEQPKRNQVLTIPGK